MNIGHADGKFIGGFEWKAKTQTGWFGFHQSCRIQVLRMCVLLVRPQKVEKKPFFLLHKRSLRTPIAGPLALYSRMARFPTGRTFVVRFHSQHMLLYYAYH